MSRLSDAVGHGKGEIDDVRAFHRKFDQLDPPKVTHLTKRKLLERANFMLEELIEFAEASGLYLENGSLLNARFEIDEDDPDQDLAQQADALVDLCYVLKGTAAMLGLGAAWPDLWDDVQRANMAKTKGPTHRNMGHGADICKPEGWAGPRTGEILEYHGYRREDFTGWTSQRVDDSLCLDDEGAPR